MTDPAGMQRQFCTAKDQVFANGDLVYLFKGCFTLRKFALNRKFLHFAKKKQVDIVPVPVRANIDPFAYQKASFGTIPFKICDIDWPARLDPTTDPAADFDDLAYYLDPEKYQEQAIRHNMELLIMTKMLDTHAVHIRRLKIRMSLDVEVSDVFRNAYLPIHRFLKALAKCTAMETLTIVQTDHVTRDAKLTSVQCRLFDVIKTMHQLKVLDFYGNMTIDETNARLDPINGTQNQLTMIDYLPPSLCELIIRDGPTPRMYKWREFYGFSAGLKLVLWNAGGRFPLLKSISLPSSFWSLMPHEFGGFVLYINSQHITTIRFSDPFKLNKRPMKAVMNGAPVPKPKYGLHYLIVTLVQDMVIDIRGANEAERAERIQWAMQIITSSVIKPITRSDGEYTTITLHKSHKCTVQVLI
jgi:hypothetical protein